MSSIRLALKQSLLESGKQSSSSSERKRKRGKKKMKKMKMSRMNSYSDDEGGNDEGQISRRNVDGDLSNDDTSEENEFVEPIDEDDENESDSEDGSDDSDDPNRESTIRHRRRRGNSTDDDDNDGVGGGSDHKVRKNDKNDDDSGNESSTSTVEQKEALQHQRQYRKSPIPSSHDERSRKEQHSAANMIQNGWKRKQGKKSSKYDDDEDENDEDDHDKSPPRDDENQDSDREHNDGHKFKQRRNEDVPIIQSSVRRKKQKQPGTKNDSLATKTVTPPDQSIIAWINSMPTKKCRRSIAPGMRVKVQFDTKVAVKRRERNPDGTEHITKEIAQKKKWFGGRVSAVSKEGSKIRIKYDDGTSEVTKFPDSDVVVDDTDNGEHQVHADVFNPPSSSLLLKVEELSAPQSPTIVQNSTKHLISLGRTGNSLTLSSADQQIEASDLVDTPLQHIAISNACSLKNAPKICLHPEVCTQEQTSIAITEHQQSAILRSSSDHSRRSASSPLMSSRSSPSRMTTPPPLPRSPVFDHEYQQEEKDTYLQQRDSAMDFDSPLAPSPHDEPTLGNTFIGNHDTETTVDGVSDLARKVDTPRPDSEHLSQSEKVNSTAVSSEAATERNLASNFHNIEVSDKNDDAPLADDVSVDFNSNMDSSKHMQERSINHHLENTVELNAPTEEESRSNVVEPHGSSSVSIENVSSLIKKDAEQFNQIGPREKQQEVAKSTFKIRLPALPPDVDGKSPRSSKIMISDGPSYEPKKPPRKKKLREEEDPVSLVPVTSNEPKIHVLSHKQQLVASESESNENVENPSSSELPSHVSPKPSQKRKTSADTNSSLVGTSPKLSPHLRKKRKKFGLKAVAASKEIHKKQTDSNMNSDTECKNNVNETDTLPVVPVLVADAPTAISKLVRIKKSQNGTASSFSVESTVGVSAVKHDKTEAMTTMDEADKMMLSSETKKSSDEKAGAVRSGRRAAQQANERISSNTCTDPQGGKKKKKSKDDTEKKSIDEVAGVGVTTFDDNRWVQCDQCGKWRVIPSNVVDSLPDKWFCSDNIYDRKRATCEAPEQTDKEVAKEKKRKLKKQQRLLMQHTNDKVNSVEEELVLSDSVPKFDMNDEVVLSTDKMSSEDKLSLDYTTIPTKKVKDKVVERCRTPQPQPMEIESAPVSESKTKRQVSSESNSFAISAEESSMDPQSIPNANSSKQERRLSTMGKKMKLVSADVQQTESAVSKGTNSSFDAVEVRRGRGRPRRNHGKDINNHSEGIVSVDGHKVEDDNLEWVQCEKCEKWRRLPSHISADDLPEQWYCELNTWSPESASCDVQEDKADGMQDIGGFGGTGGLGIGKLTYRNLIFGSTGRKLNRPVTEKARAAESLFSIHHDEDDAPTRVLYADSSSFISRTRPNIFSGDESENRMSVLDLMSHSSLWTELRNAALARSNIERNTFLGQYELGARVASYTYETLPAEMKQQMKDMVLYFLDDDSNTVLSGEELFVRGQNTTLVSSLSNEFENARRYWTINVVVTTVVQLVKEGRAECVRKPVPETLYGGMTTFHADRYTPYYRKAVVHSSKRSTVSNESTEEQNVTSQMVDDCYRHQSRFMKIAKPWKRVR